MLGYLSFYCYVIILNIISYTLDKKIFYYFSVASICIFGALRWEVGYDFGVYREIYNHLYIMQVEPGFHLFMLFLSKLNISEVGFFSLSYVIPFLLIIKGIKKYSKYTKLSLILYILTPGIFLNSFSIIRQNMALSIMFFSVDYLIKKKYWKYFMLSGIAISIHLTAFIPMVFFIFIKKLDKYCIKFNVYFVLILISLILFKLNFSSIILNFLSGRYRAYIDWIEPVSLLKLLISNFIIIYMLINKEKIVKINSNYNFFINLIFVSILILNIFGKYTPITRLTYYFRIFEIILFPTLIYVTSKNNLKVLILLILTSYYFLMTINSLSNDINSEAKYKMIPYKNILFLKK